MNADIAQSMAMLVMGVLAIIILLRILMIVHSQTKQVNELELRMKAMEKTETKPVAASAPDRKEA